MNDANFDNDVEYYSKFYGPCVGPPVNKNFTGPQKDLLLWHWKIRVSMYHIQGFTRDRIYEETTGKISIMSPTIKPKYPETRNCSVLVCKSCIMDRSKKRSTGSTKVDPLR